MKKKLLFGILTISILLAGCSGQDTQKSSELKGNTENEAAEEGQGAETEGQDVEESAAEQGEEAAQENEPETMEDEENSKSEKVEGSDSLTYQQLSEFTFQMFYDPESELPVETIHMHEDGTFVGSYTYLDEELKTDEYPSGTVYYCNFEGTFGPLKQVNEYMYMMTLEEVELLNESADDTVQDGLNYVYSPIYNFENTRRLYLYLPGTPYSELPQTFKYYIYIPEGAETFQSYGLFSPLTQSVWTSEYAPEEQVVSARDHVLTKEEAMQEIQFCEEEEQEIQEIVNSEAATQMLLNISAGREYDLWDMELNRIWRALKQTLDEEEMNTLYVEQKSWIREKEQAVEEEGQLWEGGSGEPMARASVAADYTKKRVYELVEYLK